MMQETSTPGGLGAAPPPGPAQAESMEGETGEPLTWKARLRLWIWPPQPWSLDRWLVLAVLAALTIPVGPALLALVVGLVHLQQWRRERAAARRPGPPPPHTEPVADAGLTGQANPANPVAALDQSAPPDRKVRRRWRPLAWLGRAFRPIRLLIWPPLPWPVSRWIVAAMVMVVLGPGLAFAGLVFAVKVFYLEDDLLALIVPAAPAIAVLVIAWVSRTVGRPLAALRQATEHIGRGDLDFELPRARVREVQELAQSFDAMRQGLREAIVRQAELEQQRRELVAAISHDLRTPITSVRGYLEGLQDGVAQTPEQRDHYVAVALEKTAVLERLIHDLFDYTRLEYLDQPPQPEAVDLEPFLEKVLAGFLPQAQNEQVTLEKVPGPAVQVTADPLLLERALANLLDNALRHTPSGGRITLAWMQTETGLAISVTDSGPGIAPRDLPHLFDPLYRGEKSRSRHTGGAGLGLAIAQRIAQAHGGNLTAANGASGGACFTLTLPARA